MEAPLGSKESFSKIDMVVDGDSFINEMAAVRPAGAPPTIAQSTDGTSLLREETEEKATAHGIITQKKRMLGLILSG